VGIRASDIILADTEPLGSSARNRLPGVVSGIELRPPGYQVTLACGTVDLKCHITGTSLNEMGITIGDDLWAVFKASSCFLVSDDGE
jgi:molybdopterin-binding protein